LIPDFRESEVKIFVELRGDNSYTHRIKEEPVDYEFIEFEAVKPREIVAESTVHLDTHSSTAEKSNLDKYFSKFVTGHKLLSVRDMTTVFPSQYMSVLLLGIKINS
jgi:hypothetical protein